MPQSILPMAGRISVTVIHDSTKSYGVRLAPNHGPDRNASDRDSHSEDFVIDMIANNHCNGMLKGSPLSEGDILRTINNQRAANFLGCGDSRNSDGRSSYVRGANFRDGQSVTFVAERPPEHERESDGLENEESERHSAVVRAFCRRSNGSNKNDGSAMAVGIEFHRVIVGEEEDDDDDDGRNSSDTDIDSDADDSSPSPCSSPCSSPSTNSSHFSSFLQIDRVDPNGLFAHSVLNQGDIVLAINGYSICADENTTVEEANELMGVRSALEHTPSPSTALGVSVYETVDILALNPRKLLELKRHGNSSRPNNFVSLWGNRRERRRKIKQQAKRMGVAIGGGAMIGVGLVVHPFGTLLIPSGVSVLGTEFETPNKMVRSARDSLEKWVVNDEHVLEFSKDPTQADGKWLGGDPIAITPKGASIDRKNTGHNDSDATPKSTPQSSPRPPLPRMTNRMKGIGRRYVLPFLDRMAGDRRNISGIASSSSFDINDSYNNTVAGTSQQQQGQLPLQKRRHELQGRDDDCGQCHGSSFSLEQNPQPSSISQRVT